MPIDFTIFNMESVPVETIGNTILWLQILRIFYIIANLCCNLENSKEGGCFNLINIID